MPLSAANALQAKTGSALGNVAAAVALDEGTKAGSTVTIELHAGGLPLLDGGLGGHVPDGFELDAISDANNVRYQYVFRKRDVAAGEGVSGSTTWDFNYSAALGWTWRVTEWDRELEPVSPLERTATNWATGTSPTSLSTGTTVATTRAEVVALAWHHWSRGLNTAQTMTFSGHTNGFGIRDELRLTSGTAEWADCWSWLFATSTAAFETTAAINLASRDAQDIYSALLVVYAATTYGT